MNQNALAAGVTFLNFLKNTFDSDCDEIRLEAQSRKFLRKSNLNEIVNMCIIQHDVGIGSVRPNYTCIRPDY